MVQHFLAGQKRKLLHQTRQQLAISVAASFDWSRATARRIVQWENSWVTSCQIPTRKKSEMYALWLTDENVVMAICEFARKQGDSKKITIINWE